MRSSALVCSLPAVASESPQGSQSWVLHSGHCSENFIFLEFVYGSSCTLGAIVSGDLPFGTQEVPLFK